MGQVGEAGWVYMIKGSSLDELLIAVELEWFAPRWVQNGVYTVVATRSIDESEAPIDHWPGHM